ncbi:MAG: hypothetical protein AB7O65_11580, partial [Candidatus Korobacteraceae bacterium]
LSAPERAKLLHPAVVQFGPRTSNPTPNFKDSVIPSEAGGRACNSYHTLHYPPSQSFRTQRFFLECP